MSQYFSVAEYFFKQNRYQESLEEVKKGLEEDPENPTLLAFQSLCLLKIKKYSECEVSLRAALSQDANNDFAHYINASLELERGRFKLAGAHIKNAIDINPINAEYYGILALTLYNRHRGHEEIKKAASTGLSFDPQNNICRNVLAMVELRGGKKKLAKNIMELQLEKDPENALSLTNQGWNLLHQGEYHNAQRHFQTALEYEPDNEWARTGLLQATKTKFPLYKYLLKYFLLLSRMSPAKRFALIFGSYVLIALLAQSNTFLESFGGKAIIFYAGFVYLTWLGESLANLALAVSPKTKHLLRPSEKRNSMVMSAFLTVTFVLGAMYVISPKQWLLMACCGSFLLSIPLTLALQEENKRKRKWYFGILSGFGAVAVVLLSLPLFLKQAVWEAMASATATGFVLSLLLFTATMFFSRK